MDKRILALIAVSIATLIYGVNYTIAKEVMPIYIKPFAFILLRVAGGTLLFWFAGLFVKSQKIEKGDYKKIFLAAFFGTALNMLAFFKGLSLTAPISASVIMVTSPIMVLIFSSILIRQAISIRRILGIFIGLAGAILLIAYGNSNNADAANSNFGNFLVFINAASYGLYLVLAKDLILKYHPIVFVKWLYFFGLFFVIPFSYNELTEVVWQEIPTNIYWNIGFVIVFTSCITYLFNLYGLSKLKPTTVSVFIYLQPVIATIYALIVGSDSLNFVKVIATIIIFLGVYLVTKQVDKSTK
ncbi:EamA family transporter [Polaribacter reichenbachii]|uniref:Multidrug transporter n=1 Tax=Polaribacter reichenbachii TaxID=996801 RepID=A0A1B8TYL2_9FLAO|nr:DMT family transporter [Polaribacter reichenbachii]APZ45905.1 EamA family transporter [Polaribacter reichenbachii]AUC19767.1 EamA family transporter [Polaribacter reichenbachii]OBY64664.1 multidrug transporter [Polaribacter reichenbachii]